MRKTTDKLKQTPMNATVSMLHRMGLNRHLIANPKNKGDIQSTNMRGSIISQRANPQYVIPSVQMGAKDTIAISTEIQRLIKNTWLSTKYIAHKYKTAATLK